MFFVWNVLFKSVQYFNQISVKLLQLEITLFQFRFAHFFQTFLGIKVTSLPVETCMWKNMLFNFFFFTLVLVGVFIACVSYSFYSSFVLAYHLKIIFLQFEHTFLRAGRLLLFLSCSLPQNVHLVINLVVGLLIIFLLIELFNQFSLL